MRFRPYGERMTSLARLHLDRLADLLVRDGCAPHEAALRYVAGEARDLGLSAVLCDIVESSDEPPIARLRAFGMLAGLLGADDEPSAAPAGDSAVPEVLPSHRDTLLVDVA